MKKYTPISCDFHSHLEHFAVCRENVEIEIKHGESSIVLNGVIDDLITKSGEEFLQIRGFKYRLDQIVRVNAIYLNQFASCSRSF